MVNRRSVIRIDDNTFLREPTQFRIVIIAVAIAICAAYLIGGARGIGAGDRDVVFSPAVDPQVQLQTAAADVPLGAPTTLTTLTARGSLAVALGRRSAIRDFAAVSTAVAAVAFAAILRTAGFPTLVVIAAMLGLSFGDTFWWRGISYSADALFPALFLVAILAALQHQVWPRRSMAIIAAVAAVVAVVDFVRPLAWRTFGMPDAPGFVSSLTHEFTPLGLFLAAVGAVVLLQSRRTRLQAAIGGVVLLAWHWLWRSPIDPVNVLLVIAGWFAIATALSWLHAMLPPRSRTLILAVAAAVLIATPVVTRARVHTLGGDLSSERRTRTALDFPFREAPEGVIVIAESRRADAAMLLSSRLAGRPITIVPQSAEAVADAMETGRPIVAFENGGANLERRGFLFEPATVGHVMMAAVAGHVPCAALADDTWTDVSMLAANGSLIVHGGSNAAPAGVVIRMAAPDPVRVAAVDPREVRFEIGEVARDVEGVRELLDIADDGSAALSSMRIPATGRPSPITVSFASPPAYALATAEDPIATSICPGVQRGGVMLGASTPATASVSMNDNAPFGSGWHPVEADPDFFRWTAAPDSSLRVSLARPGAVRVTITATPASRPAQRPAIGLTVNSCRLEMQAMQPGQGDYEWRVEERCWRPGVNQLWIHTSPLISPASLFATHDKRLLGSRIGAIRLSRQ